LGFAFQRPLGGSRAAARCRGFASSARLKSPLGAAPGLLRNLTFVRRRQTNPGAARFRETYRDRLFGGPSAVFAFSDVMHLFTDELAGLRARGLAFSFSVFGSLDRLFLRHDRPPCHTY
jgi:hypothetical protein